MMTGVVLGSCLQVLNDTMLSFSGRADTPNLALHGPGFVHDAPVSIAQSRLNAGRIEYLVKWSGCRSSCDSWETAEKLSLSMVANFHCGASIHVQQHLMLEMQSPYEYVYDGEAGGINPLAQPIAAPMTAIKIEREQQDRDMLFDHWNKLSKEHRQSPEMMTAIRNTISYLGLSPEGETISCIATITCPPHALTGFGLTRLTVTLSRCGTILCGPVGCFLRPGTNHADHIR